MGPSKYTRHRTLGQVKRQESDARFFRTPSENEIQRWDREGATQQKETDKARSRAQARARAQKKQESVRRLRNEGFQAYRANSRPLSELATNVPAGQSLVHQFFSPSKKTPKKAGTTTRPKFNVLCTPEKPQLLDLSGSSFSTQAQSTNSINGADAIQSSSPSAESEKRVNHEDDAEQEHPKEDFETLPTLQEILLASKFRSSCYPPRDKTLSDERERHGHSYNVGTF